MSIPVAFSTPLYLRPVPTLQTPFPSRTTLPAPTTTLRSRRHLRKSCPQAVSPDLSPDRTLLSNRLAVVTGGHRGLGASISLALGSRGADVIVIDRGGPQDSTVPSQLTSLGRSHWSVQADVSDVSALRAAVSSVCDIAGARGVDILVNNAGISRLAPLTHLSVDDWDATLAVNLRAPFLLSQMIANGPDGMIARGSGAIVNVSSLAGSHAIHEHAAYCASKAALEMLTKVMTTEWGPSGLRINSVAPTVVLTDMGRRVWSAPEKGKPVLARTPQGRFAEAWEVADVVAFLASDASAMVNGQIVAVDGGLSAL